VSERVGAREERAVAQHRKFTCWEGGERQYRYACPSRHPTTQAETEEQTDAEADRQTDRQTGRQTDRQTDRQTGRQAGRQGKGTGRDERICGGSSCRFLLTNSEDSQPKQRCQHAQAENEIN